MNELRPILGDDPTEDERRLLGSARLDVPPRSGKGRTLAAMGVAAAMTAAAGTSGASATTVGAGLMIKWMALGALGGTIALGAAGGLTPLVRGFEHRSPNVVSAAPPASPPTHPVPEVPAMSRSLTAHLPPADNSEETAPPVAPLDLAAAVPPAATARTGPTRRPAPWAGAPQEPAIGPPAVETTLAAEVAALDDARRALASGSANSALRALDAYDLRFTRHRLGPEAKVLRIEILLAQGRQQQAHELGDALLAADPDGAYAQHVRSLLSGTDR